MRRRWFFAVGVVGIGVAGSLFSTGCFNFFTSASVAPDKFEWHSVWVDCTCAPEGRLLIQLKARGINTIRTLLVSSESKAEPLWFVKLVREPADLKTITYGEVPQVREGHLHWHRIRQVFPRDTTPRQMAPGERFFVTVSYQYDTAFPPAPCGGTRDFAFQMGADGSVSALGIVSDGKDHDKLQEIRDKVRKAAEEEL